MYCSDSKLAEQFLTRDSFSEIIKSKSYTRPFLSIKRGTNKHSFLLKNKQKKKKRYLVKKQKRPRPNLLMFLTGNT